MCSLTWPFILVRLLLLEEHLISLSCPPAPSFILRQLPSFSRNIPKHGISAVVKMKILGQNLKIKKEIMFF